MSSKRIWVLVTFLWILTSLHFPHTYSIHFLKNINTTCDLDFEHSSNRVNLLDVDEDKVYHEATTTVQCFINNTSEVGENVIEISEEREMNIGYFRCLITEIKRLLKCSETIAVPDKDMMELFFDGTLDKELNNSYLYNHSCVLPLVVHFTSLIYDELIAINFDEETCDFFPNGIVRNISLWFELTQKIQFFIFELEYVKYVRSNNNYTEFLLSSWIERFLDIKTWETYEFNVRTYMMTISTDAELGSGVELFLLFLHGVLFCVGFLGNTILLIIFVRHREMLSSHNTMILNLAIGDMFSLIFNIIVSYTFNLSDSTAVGFLVCLSITLFIPLSTGVCVYSVTMLSFQRFLAVISAGKRNGCAFFKRLSSVVFIIVVWVLACISAIPQFIKTGFHEDYCEVELTASRIIFNLILYCVIPVILVALFSTATSHAMRKSVKKMPGEVVGSQKAVRNARTRSAHILIGLIVVFTISYLPYYLFLFAFTYFNIEQFAFDNIFIISYTLIFINSCCNPIALYVVSGVFRAYFNKYLLCCCHRKFQLWRNKTDTSSRSTQKSGISE